jgi:hypothetical protein
MTREHYQRKRGAGIVAGEPHANQSLNTTASGELVFLAFEKPGDQRVVGLALGAQAIDDGT